MIIYLHNWLAKDFSVLNILHYVSFRSFLAAAISFSLSLCWGKSFINYLSGLKAKQQIRLEGPQSHQVKRGVPTMGGLLMITTLTISSLVCVDWSCLFLWLLILGILAFGAIGFWDDYLKISKGNSDGLSAGVKMLLLVFVALSLSSVIYMIDPFQAGQIYVPFFKEPLFNIGYFSIFFGLFLLCSSTNAVNLTDGLDGLASGLSLMVILAFAVISYLTGRLDFSHYLNIAYVPQANEIAVFACALGGSVAGFLWFNAHPAQIMMGDVGSLFLGGVLGLLAMLLKKEVLFIFLGGIFVLETLSVIIQVSVYKKTKKRVFRMAPLHHHFELLGWSETKVVIRFWIMGAFLALASLATLKLQ